ncbi:Gluconate transport inducer 1 [Leucoagaricus sp. SymC.cos]|nr:Gluconate transport inducer 1 [Leucoagaricus sp. SymC.cos]
MTTSNPDVPPFIGYVETTVHALRLIHAARQGVIPRITRRLNDSERRTMIKSGAVFVFSVEESGIKRWTDGLLWSPSRIVGNFLVGLCTTLTVPFDSTLSFQVYREINERSSSRSGHKKPYPQEDPSGRSLARRNSPDQLSYKSLTSGHPSNDQGTFKPNGLIKKTITVTIEGSDLHLISYYTSEDIRSGILKRPTTRPDIMGIPMPPHIFRLTNFRVPPKVEIGPDGKPRLVCEAEDLPAPECKVEEPVYHVPDASGWNSCTTHLMPVDNISAGSPVHSLSHGHSISHNMYGRSSTSDRWTNSPGAESLLSSIPVRQELPWTPTLHSAHPSIARRRDSNHLSPTDSWSSLNGSSARWLGTHEGSNTHTSPYLEQRARIRSSGHPYEEAASIRRESESLSPSYGSRFPGHCPGGRDSSNHRGLSWHQRDLENLKDSRSHANHHTETSFTPSPTLPFSTSGYQQHHHHQTHQHPTSHTYNSSWSSTDTSVLEAPVALQALPSSTTISYDTSSYANSATMSGSEGFANVDDM